MGKISNFTIIKRTFEGKNDPTKNGNPITSEYNTCNKYVVSYELEGLQRSPILRCVRSEKDALAFVLENLGMGNTAAMEEFYRQLMKALDLPLRPEASITIDKQVIAAIRKNNIPCVRFEYAKNGNVTVVMDTMEFGVTDEDFNALDRLASNYCTEICSLDAGICDDCPVSKMVKHYMAETGRN